ncbi:MAG: glycosyltransferase family 2 protein [Burkholderiaceae bacterium]|nr:glycosyltransferase family 2 protein [Burkholderiaceae bacterium]
MHMYSVAVAMIVRNEAALIAKCLRSIAPWVDHMLVLDTGSTDDTVHIARRAGARVECFAWVDDFSAARNRALELADADWNVVLDADELVSTGAEVIAQLRGMAPDFVGAIRQDNHFGASASEGFASTWISRVLPRGVRYSGRIHEQPQHQFAVRKLDVHLDHAGYTPAAMVAKDGRNAALLARALSDAPGDGYMLYQLGKDHSVYQRFELAAHYFEQADRALPPGLTIAHDLLLRWLFALKKCHQHPHAIELAQSRMSFWQGSPDYWFTVGDVLLDWACEEPARAAALLPMVESSWLQCLEIGERPDLEGAVQGRGSYLAAKNLAVIYEGLGRLDEARKYRLMATAQGSTHAVQ